jgi:hypothetical protein
MASVWMRRRTQPVSRWATRCLVFVGFGVGIVVAPWVNADAPARESVSAAEQ